LESTVTRGNEAGAAGVDEVAEATQSTGREVLTALGSRFHRIYYAT